MKSVFIILVLALSGLAMPAAAAAESSMTTTVLKRTSCDQRAPRVEINLNVKAQRVGYGYPESDDIYWLDTDGVAAGTHPYTLKRQPFGSTRQWVMVAAFKGDQGLYTNKTLTFKRPSRSACVARRVVSLQTFRAGINTPCSKGTVTQYIVTVRVKRGTPGYVFRTGTATLVQRNGRELRSGGGYIVPRVNRIAEYYIYGGRRSQLRLDALLNQARLTTSSPGVELVASVFRNCQLNEEYLT